MTFGEKESEHIGGKMHTRELLIRASEIVKRHEHLARTQGAYFNVFDILDRATDEVKGHSAFIAEMLNPEGSHGQGDLFLKLFFRGLRSAGRRTLAGLPSDMEDRQWSVAREMSFTGPVAGRIDIAIEATGTPGILLAIENKIKHQDEERQLERYWHYGQSRQLGTCLFYLTLDGSEPSKESLGELPLESVVLLSYAGFIVPWLDDCIAAAAQLPNIRETLVQYQHLVTGLAGGSWNKERTMELKKLLKDPADLRAAAELGQALAAKKVEIQLAFWSKLQERFCEKACLGTGELVAWFSYTKEKVTDFCARSRGKKSYGIGLPLTDLDAGRSVMFGLEVYNNFYFAFSVIKDGAQIDPGDDDKTARVIEIASRILPKSEGVWFAYDYPVPRLDFRVFDDACMKLASPTYLNDCVDRLGDQAAEILKFFTSAYGRNS